MPNSPCVHSGFVTLELQTSPLAYNHAGAFCFRIHLRNTSFGLDAFCFEPAASLLSLRSLSLRPPCSQERSRRDCSLISLLSSQECDSTKWLLFGAWSPLHTQAPLLPRLSSYSTKAVDLYSLQSLVRYAGYRDRAHPQYAARVSTTDLEFLLGYGIPDIHSPALYFCLGHI